MARKDSAADPGAAITRVLNAERDARKAIEKCVAQAEKTLADARSRARGIVRTAQRRIGRLHAVAGTETERRVHELENSAPGGDFRAVPADAARTLLQRAAADTARTLTTRNEAQDAD